MCSPISTDYCNNCAMRPELASERADPRTAFTATTKRHYHSRHSTMSFACKSCENIQNLSEKNSTCHTDISTAFKAVAKHTSCSLHNSHKTKSYFFLLVFLCAIFLESTLAKPITASGQRLIYHSSVYRERYHQQLLQEKRSQVPPTVRHHHLHHRSVNSMPETASPQLRSASASGSQGAESGNSEPNQLDCRKVTDVLELPFTQANSSFNTIKTILKNYTRELYQKQDIDQVHTNWKKHKLNLEHELKSFLPPSFFENPNLNHLASGSISKDLIRNELHRIYSTLETLKAAFVDVINDHEKNEMEIKHELDIMLQHSTDTTANGLYEHLEEFFNKVLENICFNLNASKDAMQKLGIELPTVRVARLSLDNRREPRDWLLIEEFLCVMQYMRAAYRGMVSQCGAILQ